MVATRAIFVNEVRNHLPLSLSLSVSLRGSNNFSTRDQVESERKVKMNEQEEERGYRFSRFFVDEDESKCGFVRSSFA